MELKTTPFLLSRFASDTGLPTGTLSAVGDYSSTAKDFYIEALEGERLSVARVMIHIVDGGAFDSGSYGNGITLTNGIKFIYERQGVQLDVSNAFPIKTNVDWGRYCYDVNISSYGSGNEALDARWSFSKYGEPLILDQGDKIILRMNDDLTGLIEHTFLFEGVHLQEPNPASITVVS